MSATDLVQRSPEWLAARTGSLGASQVETATAVLKKGGRSKASSDLMFEVAAERLTGVPAKQVNARQWGVDNEPAARAAYAFMTNAAVVEVGLIPHPRIAGTHASPDALVGDDGGLEMKCPTSATHLQTLFSGVVPEEHMAQINWGLACSGRAWWDFASFDPRFPPALQLFVKRVERDEAAIAVLENEVRAFLDSVDVMLGTIETLYPAEGAA